MGSNLEEVDVRAEDCRTPLLRGEGEHDQLTTAAIFYIFRYTFMNCAAFMYNHIYFPPTIKWIYLWCSPEKMLATTAIGDAQGMWGSAKYLVYACILYGKYYLESSFISILFLHVLTNLEEHFFPLNNCVLLCIYEYMWVAMLLN